MNLEQMTPNLLEDAQALRDQAAAFIFQSDNTTAGDELLESLRSFTQNLLKQTQEAALKISADENDPLYVLKALAQSIIVSTTLLEQLSPNTEDEIRQLRELALWLEDDVLDLLNNPVLISRIRVPEGGGEHNIPRTPRPSRLRGLETGGQPGIPPTPR